MKLSVVVCLLVLVGCTYSAPSFREVSRTWDSSGRLIEEHIVKGRQPTVAAPFSSRAFSTQRLELEQMTLDRWRITMGSNADIRGGEVSPTIEAVGSGLVTPLVDRLPVNPMLGFRR